MRLRGWTPALMALVLGTHGLSGEEAFAQGSTTSIGGYGDAVYSRDVHAESSQVDLERFVLFVGHEFSKKISLVSELEMEDAKVTGGEAGGEIAFEQAYIQFRLDPAHSIVAGLFLPRIGILNENHLPTSFNGNERTQVETFIIPSTWRELGVGFYGNNDLLPVEYSVAIVNGLDASGFTHGSLIREGRFEGRNATANNLAVTGSVGFSPGPFRVQVSGYYGGSVGLSPSASDSIGLRGGPFGTPVALGEADVQFNAGPFAARALGALVSIPDAAAINRAFGNGTPRSAYGAYAEVSYDILYAPGAEDKPSLTAFLRYERLNLNAAIPAGIDPDPSLDQHHIITGISYAPIRDIVFKADARFTRTAPDNAGPGSGASSGTNGSTTTFLTLGIGFSF